MIANSDLLRKVMDNPDLVDAWKKLDDVGHDVRKNTDLLKKIDDGGFDIDKVSDLYKNQKAPEGFKGKVDYPATKTIDGKQVTVRYDKEGFPDFKDHSLGKDFTYKADDLVGNSTTTDFTKATNWLKSKYPDKNIRKVGTKVEIDGKQYTWHHHQDGKSLMPVDPDVHEAFRHSGGSTVIDKGLQGLFESPY